MGWDRLLRRMAPGLSGVHIVEAGKSLFQPTDVVIDATVRNLWGAGPAILLRRQHLDQLAPPGNQCFERLGLLVG